MKYLNCALIVMRQWFMLLFYLMTQHTQEPYPWITEEQTSSDFSVISIAPLFVRKDQHLGEEVTETTKSSSSGLYVACHHKNSSILLLPALARKQGRPSSSSQALGRAGVRTWILQDCGHMYDNPRRMPCIPSSMKWSEATAGNPPDL